MPMLLPFCDFAVSLLQSCLLERFLIPDSLPLTTLAKSTLLLVSNCVFRCWMVPIGMKHHGNQTCSFLHCEMDTAFSLFLAT